MGSGKTSVGKTLSKLLNFKLIDTDKYIVHQEDRSVSAIFQEKGEVYFRDLESNTLRFISNLKDNHVISTGGGMPLNPKNIELMKEVGIVFYLNVSNELLFTRLNGDKKRPLLQNQSDLFKYIENEMQKRRPFYIKADFIIDGGQTKKEIVSEIFEKWNAI